MQPEMENSNSILSVAHYLHLPNNIFPKVKVPMTNPPILNVTIKKWLTKAKFQNKCYTKIVIFRSK